MKKAFLMFLILFSCNALSVGEEVSMACNDFPPLKIGNGTKDKPGFDIEILNNSFKHSNSKLKTKFYPWKRALTLGQEGQVDGLCSCSHSKEREGDFLFSEEMGRISIGVYTKNNIDIKTLNDIKKDKEHVVGVVRGYEIENELEEQGILTSLGTSDFSLLRMLEADRFFAVYSYKVVVSELMKDHNFIKKFKYTEIKSIPYYSCFGLKNPRAKKNLKKFNDGLKKLRENGDYQKIAKKYGLD